VKAAQPVARQHSTALVCSSGSCVLFPGAIILKNPFLGIPQIESAASRSWAAGFLYGYQGPEQSSMAQGDVDTLGGAVDLSIAGCELQLTSIFRHQADAAAAAQAIGRSQWLVVSWRTDQSGGMRVVESSAD